MQAYAGNRHQGLYRLECKGQGVGGEGGTEAVEERPTSLVQGRLLSSNGAGSVGSLRGARATALQLLGDLEEAKAKAAALERESRVCRLAERSLASPVQRRAFGALGLLEPPTGRVLEGKGGATGRG
eukprot:6208592-Prymnesium_polylepis.1